MPGAVADRQRVVVADDSRLMRRMLADALGRQGLSALGTPARALSAVVGHLTISATAIAEGPFAPRCKRQNPDHRAGREDRMG
jgi:hypothetical protein